jgi:hypothetical protein
VIRGKPRILRYKLWINDDLEPTRMIAEMEKQKSAMATNLFSPAA